MRRRRVYLDDVTPVVRGYPAAVVSNGVAFVSGVRGGGATRGAGLPDTLDGFTDGPMAPHAPERQVVADTWRLHDNLQKVLEAAGSGYDQLLRMHVWQRDKRFMAVRERVKMQQAAPPPPSSGLGVRELVGRFSGWAGFDGLAVVPGENPDFPRRETTRTFDNAALPSASFYSQAIRCGDLVFLAGHIPVATNQPGKPVIRGFDDVPQAGRFLATGRSHPDSREGPIAAQTWYVYDTIRENLASQGLDMGSIFHVTIFLQDIRDFATFHRVHRHFFPDGSEPALVVTGFAEVGHRGTLIEIEPTAVRPAERCVPQPVAWPHRQPFAGPAAVRVGPLCYFAGMLGMNAAGRLARGSFDLGDDETGVRTCEDLERYESHPGFAAQCWAAWRLIEQVSAKAGLSLRQVAKTTVYVRGREDIWIYEEIREVFLRGDDMPAVEFVAIPSPGPFPDAHVQIEAIASDD